MNIHKSTEVKLLSVALLMTARFAYAAPDAKSPALIAQATSGASLDALKKIQSSWEFLKNPAVKQSMMTAMGNKFPLFKQRTETLDQTHVSGNEIYSQGGAHGLYTIQESAYSYNTKTGRMQVALLDGVTLNVWGVGSQTALSKPMLKYITDLQSREEDRQLHVIFTPPDKSTIRPSEPQTTATKSSVPKNLDLSSPTGTYERPGDTMGATLDVVQEAPDQLKFDLIAYFKSNTGEASGTVQMTNNKGTYKGDGYQLVFDYKGSSFKVTQTGDAAFGGMNVRADGVYNKTSSKKPTLPDDQ